MTRLSISSRTFRHIAGIAILCLLTIIIARPARSVLSGQRGPTPAVEPENNPRFTEIFRLRIENANGGGIFYKPVTTQQWTRCGTVRLPAGAVNTQGYTASSWAAPGEVSATAVNAVHIKVRDENGRGVLFSLLPAELFTQPKDYKSYYSRNSTIFTDIPAGSGIFGGAQSPIIGSQVLVERASAPATPIPAAYIPAEGDVITIIVRRPARYPAEIEFENRFGGLVTMRYPDGENKIIAQVFKPVQGVGRFDGSLFTGPGRLRANHTGVVCISTSPAGQIGGFQIIPDNHGMSPEMTNARLLTQWMVIGPASVTDPSLEGVAPLFKYFLRPVYLHGEKRTIGDMLQSLIVEVRIKNGGWQPMPVVTGRVDDALKDVTHIRILFPIDPPAWLDDAAGTYK